MNQEKETTSPSPALRIERAKSALLACIAPSRMFMPFFLLHFPEYNTPEGISKVRAVWNFRSFNETVITKLEQLPTLLKAA